MSAEFSADARKCQVLYRKWLDSTGDKIDTYLLLDDYLTATTDLLERITSQSIPASATFPEVHDHFVGEDCDATTPPLEVMTRCQTCRIMMDTYLDPTSNRLRFVSHSITPGVRCAGSNRFAH